MIKLTRIDDRLVHGQVAFTWTPALDLTCLLIAKDDFMKMTLELAKPAGTKLLIKSLKDAAVFLNDERSKGMKILLLVNSVKDASEMVSEVPEINSINFGGLRMKDNARLISKAVAVDDADIIFIKELLKKGIELEIRQLPTDSKKMVEELI
jgi:fructoselysine and glucoselysine-specific PTS system IIB component